MGRKQRYNRVQQKLQPNQELKPGLSEYTTVTLINSSAVSQSSQQTFIFNWWQKEDVRIISTVLDILICWLIFRLKDFKNRHKAKIDVKETDRTRRGQTGLE